MSTSGRKTVVALAVLACCAGCGSGEESSAVSCPAGASLQAGVCLFTCPAGWARGGGDLCAPPCPSGFAAIDGACAPPCPSGTVADGVLCIPDLVGIVPAQCQDAEYDETGATGELIHVRGDGSDTEGDGSAAAPFATLERALEAAAESTAAEVSLIFGAGDYEVDTTEITTEKTAVRILGLCPDESRFALAPGAHVGLGSPDAEVEIARVAFVGGSIPLYVSGPADLAVHDASFETWDGDFAAIFWDGADGDERLLVERTAFSDGTSPGVSIAGAAQVIVQSSAFSSDADIAVVSYDVADLLIAGCRFEGAGQSAVTIDFASTGQSARIERSAAVGTWNDAILVIDSAGGGSSLEVDGVSVSSSSGSSAIRISECLAATLADVRVTGAAQTGVAAFDVGDFSLTGSTIAGAGENGFWAQGPGAVEIASSYLAGATAAGVVRQMSPESGDASLVLSGSVVTACQRGVDVEEGSFAATGNAIGANASIGIKVRLATAVSITDNVLASNYSTGIDLVSLQGTPDTVFTVEGNTVMESVGLGLSARSCGDGAIRITGNSIYGTLAGEVTNAGQTGDLGDGVGILTGTDGLPSKAQITGNSIGGNIRLGIIVDGAGSQAQVSENDFLDGNGYGLLIDDLVSSTPNLLYQNQATVDGADSSDAQGVSGVLVNNDPGGAPPVFHGGGGEPT